MFTWTGVLLHFLWFDALLVLIGATAIYLSLQRHHVPKMEPLHDRAISDDGIPILSDPAEVELQEMGFTYCGDYDLAAVATLSARIAAYLSPDARSWGTIVHIRGPHVRVHTVEFSTRLSPVGSLTTNNVQQWGFFSYPVHKVVTKAPWKRSARAIYDLHLALCEVAQANHFSALLRTPDTFARTIAEACRRDYEWQVGKRIMLRISPDTYRLTVKGSLLGTHKVLFQMIYGFLFSWYRRSDAAFCASLQKRLDRIRLTGHHPDPN